MATGPSGNCRPSVMVRVSSSLMTSSCQLPVRAALDVGPPGQVVRIVQVGGRWRRSAASSTDRGGGHDGPMTEVERKFLLTTPPGLVGGSAIQQGYLAVDGS